LRSGDIWCTFAILVDDDDDDDDDNDYDDANIDGIVDESNPVPGFLKPHFVETVMILVSRPGPTPLKDSASRPKLRSAPCFGHSLYQSVLELPQTVT